MRIFTLCALALVIGTTPVWASQPPQSTQTASQTPAERAAMQHELAGLRQRMDKLAKRMGKLSLQLALGSPPNMVYRYLADPDRGWLGVVLIPDPQADGYKVVALTPDGAAQQAGVKVDDIITKINGKPVNLSATRHQVWPLGNFKAGTAVKLALLRNGKPQTVSVKAQRGNTADWPTALIGHAYVVQLPTEQMARAASVASATARTTLGQLKPELKALLANHSNPHFAVLGTSFTPWWGLNLAPLNSDLAGYFGTQHGALVLSTQAKRYPGLKAGDIITAVNGKAVEKPEDVMRALGGQLPGMTVNLRVRRHGKAMTVKMRVPTTSQPASTKYFFQSDEPTKHP